MSLSPADWLMLLAQRLNEDRHLAVLVTTRPGRDNPSIAVVNAAVIGHPVHGGRVVAFVARPGPPVSGAGSEFSA